MNTITQNRQPKGVPTGGEFAATDRDEAAVTLTDLSAQTPEQIDVPLADAIAKRQAISREIETLEMHIERWHDTEMGYYTQKIEQAEDRLDELRPQLGVLELESARLSAEFDRRGGWSRFYLVIGGHVHASMECSTCFDTTQFAWLPEQSGKTEAEIVDAAGDAACTVCFPSAPVADPGQPRKNTLETAEQRTAREERAAAKAARDAKKAATGISLPDGAPLLSAGWVSWDGKVSRGQELKTERAAEIELVRELVNRSWSDHHAARWTEPMDEATAARNELDRSNTAAFVDRALLALAHKRDQSVDEVRAVVEAKVAAKLKKEGWTP